MILTIAELACQLSIALQEKTYSPFLVKYWTKPSIAFSSVYLVMAYLKWLSRSSHCTSEQAIAFIHSGPHQRIDLCVTLRRISCSHAAVPRLISNSADAPANAAQSRCICLLCCKDWLQKLLFKKLLVGPYQYLYVRDWPARGRVCHIADGLNTGSATALYYDGCWLSCHSCSKTWTSWISLHVKHLLGTCVVQSLSSQLQERSSG